MWPSSTGLRSTLPVGAFILPVTQTGEPSRSFGGDSGYAVELGVYDPNRVYVMQTAQPDPRQWFGTLGFTRPEHYMYEVEPEDLGLDTNPGRMAMNSLICARPRHPLPALTDLSQCSGADHTLGLVSQPRGACVRAWSGCGTDAERV